MNRYTLYDRGNDTWLIDARDHYSQRNPYGINFMTSPNPAALIQQRAEMITDQATIYLVALDTETLEIGKEWTITSPPNPAPVECTRCGSMKGTHPARDHTAGKRHILCGDCIERIARAEYFVLNSTGILKPSARRAHNSVRSHIFYEMFNHWAQVVTP